MSLGHIPWAASLDKRPGQSVLCPGPKAILPFAFMSGRWTFMAETLTKSSVLTQI